MSNSVPVPRNFSLAGMQSLSELWVSVEKIVAGRVADNEKSDIYPLDVRERQLVSLKALVTALEEAHAVARVKFKVESDASGNGDVIEKISTQDQHFQSYDFEVKHNAVVTDIAGWMTESPGKLCRRVYLEKIGTGIEFDGVFVVDYTESPSGKASFESSLEVDE